MDKGAHFFRCDLQVHTPRDLRWSGPNATTEEERLDYGRRLVAAGRQRGIDAIAITDHHCMTFVPFIRRAAAEETDSDGVVLPKEKQLIVFPGMELSLGVPCQALLIFDADLPDDMFPLVLTALAIEQNGPDEPKTREVQQLAHVQSLKQLKAELDKHAFLKGRYIVFPNVSGEGQHSLLRKGQSGKYAEMPWVGGYTDGYFDKLKDGPRNILAGREKQWGNKKIACIQTSDSRRDDHSTLGDPSTWIKWASPRAEALRQACLAEESRISRSEPQIPETNVARISVSNSSFLGPLDLDLNPQYNCLIGGRGTGKSTVLEYIRWVLCDQPPKADEDDGPNYQARRRRLIDATLKSLNASVSVVYILNGVPHLVRRSSNDGSLQMKIGSGELSSCTEDEVRALLPVQAYSQKQLSDVSVRIEELTRFITAPIRGDLERLERKIGDRAGRIRETYATRQRYRNLSSLLQKRQLEERSVSQQAQVLRESLTGLSDEDRSLLAQGPSFKAAGALVDAWRSGSGSLRSQIEEVRRLASSQLSAAQPAPEAPSAEKENLVAAFTEYTRLLERVVSSLAELADAADRIAAPERAEGPWRAWDSALGGFQRRYAEAVQRSSSHSEKLEQLRKLEASASDLSAEATRVRETITTLSTADEAYTAAREEWLGAQRERDSLIERECLALSERSSGRIRVSIRQFADASEFVSALRQYLAGSRIQSTKIEALGEAIVSAAQPRDTWLSALEELETLAIFDSADSPGEERPQIRVLTQLGLSSNDCDRVANTLAPENWLALSLTPIESVPIYEFKTGEGEYIPFKNASAGQQATALLQTLLNQPGPPLIIDQPEEDLDNPVMIKIVEQIWDAKKIRQILFASHNANLVVNGDSELVAWFDYRTTDDQSRGTVKGCGAIDVDETREAIKSIMEGGEEAFRLRREKYGF